MPAYALLGYPLEHSHSPRFFENKFREEGLKDHRFEMLEMEHLDSLMEMLDKKDIRGFSITKPHKTNIIPFLDALSPEGRQIGAVNSVKVEREEGKLILTGFNTDIEGVRKSIQSLLYATKPEALVLGTGGASMAVGYVLDELGIHWQLVSRKKTNNTITYDELTEDLIRRTKLIINATPLGMYPCTEEMPSLPYQAIGSDHILFDLIYNPPKTRFLQMGEKQGAAILNGLTMLEVQAEASWRLWNAR